MTSLVRQRSATGGAEVASRREVGSLSVGYVALTFAFTFFILPVHFWFVVSIFIWTGYLLDLGGFRSEAAVSAAEIAAETFRVHQHYYRFLISLSWIGFCIWTAGGMLLSPLLALVRASFRSSFMVNLVVVVYAWIVCFPLAWLAGRFFHIYEPNGYTLIISVLLLIAFLASYKLVPIVKRVYVFLQETEIESLWRRRA